MGPREGARLLETEQRGREIQRRFWEAAEGRRQAFGAGAADREALWWKAAPGSPADRGLGPVETEGLRTVGRLDPLKGRVKPSHSHVKTFCPLLNVVRIFGGI